MNLITKTAKEKIIQLVWRNYLNHSGERQDIFLVSKFVCYAILWEIESILAHLPANNILPINSLRPILSKSITMTSNEHSLIFSHGTLKLNESLKCGFNVHLKIGVFRFSIRLSPNWSQTLTYGSVVLVEKVT